MVTVRLGSWALRDWGLWRESAVEYDLGTSVRSLNVYDGLALLIALTLVAVGFFIGTAGSGEAGGTTQ